MFARVTPFEIDTVRMPLADAERLFEQQVVPSLRKQPGLEGYFVMRSPEGKGLVISFWATEQQATESITSGHYAESLNSFVSFMRQPPGREQYEVIFKQLPTTTAGLPR